MVAFGDKEMEEIIESYKRWKRGKDEDCQYDKIHYFMNLLDASDLILVFEWIEKHYKEGME
jgi:hypothetical protein